MRLDRPGRRPAHCDARPMTDQFGKDDSHSAFSAHLQPGPLLGETSRPNSNVARSEERHQGWGTSIGGGASTTPAGHGAVPVLPGRYRRPGLYVPVATYGGIPTSARVPECAWRDAPLSGSRRTRTVTSASEGY